MKHISLGNRLTPFLLVTCALLGIAVALQWHSLSRTDESTGAGNTSPARTNETRLTRATYMAPDFATYGEILERPLFTEGRMPPEPVASKPAAVTPAKQTRLTLRLEGVALTPEARVAVVRDITSNKLFRLAEGEKHQGWVVESVSSTGATFRRGEQTHELRLELNRRKPGTIPGMKQKNRRNR